MCERKRVAKIDPETMEVVAEYNSIAAACYYNYCTHNGITACLSGRQKKSQGYYWKEIKTKGVK